MLNNERQTRELENFILEGNRLCKRREGTNIDVDVNNTNNNNNNLINQIASALSGLTAEVARLGAQVNAMQQPTTKAA